MQSKYGLKFEMSAPSKRVILIGSDGSNNFFKTCKIGKHLEIGYFSTIKVSVNVVMKKLYENA